VGAELFHADGRTERYGKSNSPFFFAISRKRIKFSSILHEEAAGVFSIFKCLMLHRVIATVYSEKNNTPLNK